jgi:polar amino acid transport system substrate-binding protein
MNKKIGFILALIVIAFVVMGTASAGLFDFLGGGNNATKVTNDNNTFIVGFDANFPPYGFKNGSEYVGFDLDLAQEVCKRNNWTYVAQPIDWDAKDAELDSESIDCIWNGFTINGRENNYTWSDAYIDNKQVFVVKADSNISSIADLSGKVVETQKDSSALHSLEGDNKTIKDSFTNLVQVADYNTAFMDLQSGACEAVAMDIGVAQYQINSSNSSDKFIILDQPLSSEQYGVGFKLNNTQLKDKVQATLDEMYADGTIQAIAANYSSYGVPGSLILK